MKYFKIIHNTTPLKGEIGQLDRIEGGKVGIKIPSSKTLLWYSPSSLLEVTEEEYIQMYTPQATIYYVHASDDTAKETSGPFTHAKAEEEALALAKQGWNVQLLKAVSHVVMKPQLEKI